MVSGGFLEVRGTQVSVLARTAEQPGDVDVRRAQQAQERAQQRLENRSAEIDVERARLALQRANVRISGAEKDGTSV
ncbi:F0F1 ATP synthase subunit epsilon [mine drainage metagenome]|uniref:F0F1 ATP synthase subunit epsilon n=1 Tax=mine drainage metagenome TaxID=410659 RepID=T1BNS5_9ZZZZ